VIGAVVAHGQMRAGSAAMSEATHDQGIQQDAAAPDTADTTPTVPSRRLFMFKTLLGAATLASLGAVIAPAPAEAQRLRVTDSDPYDSEGRGRGRYVRRRGTDRDPYDAEGGGRMRVYRRRARVTDNDPRDPRGGGRGW
jgi:hypothetical protein